MKINKEKINQLLSLSDEALWRELSEKARGFGYSLPEKAPSGEDMKTIRRLIGEADKIGPMDALRLLTKFKAKRTGG